MTFKSSTLSNDLDFRRNSQSPPTKGAITPKLLQVTYSFKAGQGPGGHFCIPTEA